MAFEVRHLEGSAGLVAPPAQRQIMCSRSFAAPVTDLPTRIEVVSAFTSQAARKLREPRSAAASVQLLIATTLFRRRDHQHAPSATLPLARPSADTRVLIGAGVRALRSIVRPNFNDVKAGVRLANVSSDATACSIPTNPRDPLMTRSMNAWLLTLAVMLGIAGCANLNTAATKPEKTRIVLQVSDGDPKTWSQALNVVRNLQNEYGADKVDVEVVVFGNGIGLLEKDSPYASRISETIVGGTQVLICENTMAGRKKTKSDMLGDIGFVKAGVVELTEKSKAGWTIIRP